MALLDALHDQMASPEVDSILEMDSDIHADFEYVLEAMTDEKLKQGNDEVSHLLKALDDIQH